MKYKILNILLFLLFSFNLFATVAPKRIVFVICDGMGVSSITASRLFLGGSDYTLSLDKFPVLGHAKTYSLNNFVTDSAAAATALATGYKTNNRMIGMTPDRADLETLIDCAKKRGFRTGIVTNTSVTDATPASFYAHVSDRKLEYEIAGQLVDSNLDVLMGGGRVFFSSDLQKQLKKKGWIVSDDLLSSKTTPNKFLGLFADHEIPFVAEAKTSTAAPTLTQLSFEAIRLLESNQDRPFFLVIESGLIDRAGHANLARYQLYEMQELNTLLAQLMLLEDTLVVVTSDHETGGLSVSGYADRSLIQGDALWTQSVKTGRILNWATGQQKVLEREQLQVDSSRHPVFVQEDALEAAYVKYGEQHSAAHTAVDVAVFAKGPGQELFMGTFNNTEIFQKLVWVMGPVE